jgi:hypothetical protein
MKHSAVAHSFICKHYIHFAVNDIVRRWTLTWQRPAGAAEEFEKSIWDESG